MTVNVIVIYESLTGNTRKAAGYIADALREAGADVTAVNPTTAIDYAALSAAELVVIGSWTDGLFVFVELVPDAVEPLVEHLGGPGIQGRERTHDACLALGDDEFRTRYNEQRRTHDGNRQAVLKHWLQ